MYPNRYRSSHLAHQGHQCHHVHYFITSENTPPSQLQIQQTKMGYGLLNPLECGLSTGCFYTGPPPKSSKYKKVNLG